MVLNISINEYGTTFNVLNIQAKYLLSSQTIEGAYNSLINSSHCLCNSYLIHYFHFVLNYNWLLCVLLIANFIYINSCFSPLSLFIIAFCISLLHYGPYFLSC